MASPGQYSARLQRFRTQLEEVEDQLLADSQLAVSQRAAQTYMQRERIGPRDPNDTGPLRIQTSRLERSLSGAREGSQGRQEGISRVRTGGGKVVITIGSRVPYAEVHEEGFRGSVDVRPHRRTMTEGFGPDSLYPMDVVVTRHTRQMNIPARPYLGPALDDETDTIRQIIADGVIKALRNTLTE